MGAAGRDTGGIMGDTTGVTTSANADTSPGGAGGLSGRRTRLVLGVVGLSLMSVVSAVSGLNVALPDMARETGATQTQLTWIVDAYTVVFAGLLFFAGALGDRYGRRLLLFLGLVVFGAGSAAGLVTNDPTLLIVIRAVMGLGAAAIMPTTLSIITTSFPEAERPRAIGVWVGIAGGGAVLGLFATALLLEWYPWHSFFALNVGLAALAAIGVLAFVPGSADEDPPALDVPGGVLSLITVGGLVFGIIEAPDRGWTDPVTLAAFATGIAAGIAFVAWELRASHPLLDPRLFLVRGFSAGTLTIAVQFFASFGFFFIVLQYLQYVTGRSALEAALALLPLPLVLIPTARNAPLVARRLGFRRVAPVGLLSTAIGFWLLSQLMIDTPYWFFLVGVLFFGFGMGFAGTPATTAVTSSLPMSKQGVASAVNDTAREMGSAFGIAILGAVLNQSYRDALAPAVANLPAAVSERVLASIAFTASPAVAQAGAAGQALVDNARAAFVSGVSDAVFIGCVVLAVAAVAVFLIAEPGSAEVRESVSTEEREAERELAVAES
jgi:EmrB/QacA subfamily drug resistance transporter